MAVRLFLFLLPWSFVLSSSLLFNSFSFTSQKKKKEGIMNMAIFNCLYSFADDDQSNLIWEYLVLLCFTLWHFAVYVFYKLKVCVNSALGNSIDADSSNNIVHVLFLCHILLISVVFQTFSLLLLEWSVISDLLGCYCYCFKASWSVPFP